MTQGPPRRVSVTPFSYKHLKGCCNPAGLCFEPNNPCFQAEQSQLFANPSYAGAI